MKKLTDAERTARRDALEQSMIGTRWLSVSHLAARWNLSVNTVRDIPPDELRFKEFGSGMKLKRRRYKEEWVTAFENANPHYRHAPSHAA